MIFISIYFEWRDTENEQLLKALKIRGYYIVPFSLTRLAALVHAVYTEYARYLHSLGLEKSAYFFASKAGPKARQLLDGM